MEPSLACPACGYAGLDKPAWTEAGGGSQEICPSCGIQFGYDDALAGRADARWAFYRGWAGHWRQAGMRWWSPRDPPEGWDPEAQLASTPRPPELDAE
jgi:hypothetical protein